MGLCAYNIYVCVRVFTPKAHITCMHLHARARTHTHTHIGLRRSPALTTTHICTHVQMHIHTHMRMGFAPYMTLIDDDHVSLNDTAHACICVHA